MEKLNKYVKQSGCYVGRKTLKNTAGISRNSNSQIIAIYIAIKFSNHSYLDWSISSQGTARVGQENQENKYYVLYGYKCY